MRYGMAQWPVNPMAGYGALPLTAENIAAIEVDYANYMTSFLNQVTDEAYALDGTFDADRAEHLKAALEAALGKPLSQASLMEFMDVLGVDEGTAAVVQGNLAAALEKKTPWWHYALMIGGGAVGGALIGGLAVYAFKK